MEEGQGENHAEVSTVGVSIAMVTEVTRGFGEVGVRQGVVGEVNGKMGETGEVGVRMEVVGEVNAEVNGAVCETGEVGYRQGMVAEVNGYVGETGGVSEGVLESKNCLFF